MLFTTILTIHQHIESQLYIVLVAVMKLDL